ncbi:MAG: dipeptidase [Flavobacteriales bacterium]|nr:dipeptidase [Flavobacteriales bacterium]MCX7769380.1 dipeptidase [Flavobacteriales bacterium]MDW8410846.1 dipeptidase [Flavobacteriales bacterium]
MANIQDYFLQNKQTILEELMSWLRVPSISADPHYRDSVFRMADVVAESLRKAGAEHVRLLPTKGFPVVYGEKIVHPDAPTVIVYGHYDVQPPDPLELWINPPFEPQIRDEAPGFPGNIYARGAADDKGQVFIHVKALEWMLRHETLPCNVRFMIEGEEEVGSAHLPEFLEESKDLYQGDVFLISDTSLIANDIPSITVGLRGLAYMEVEVTGPRMDLHSGVYGGAVANPANVLCRMIASLHDHHGRITIPGFYDDVLELTPAERQALAEAPFDEEAYKKELGVQALWGEEGFTTPERSSIRPSLDVNGMWSGYIGEGAKTVLPSKAYAKISMRLVPNQDPEKIAELFARHFTAIAPPYVQVNVKPHHGGWPVVIPTDTPEYRAAECAMQETFGRKPVPVRGGGSIPIVALFERILGLKSVLMGFGLDSDAIHSPNERFGIYNLFKGIETVPAFYRHYARLKNS